MKLTERQERILELIREGRPYKQIAFDLGITTQCLKIHAKNIRRKMGMQGLGKHVMLRETMDGTDKEA